VNPDHQIVKKIGDTDDENLIAGLSTILLDQAFLVEGVMLKEPADFVKRLNEVLSKSL